MLSFSPTPLDCRRAGELVLATHPFVPYQVRDISGGHVLLFGLLDHRHSSNRSRCKSSVDELVLRVTRNSRTFYCQSRTSAPKHGHHDPSWFPGVSSLWSVLLSLGRWVKNCKYLRFSPWAAHPTFASTTLLEILQTLIIFKHYFFSDEIDIVIIKSWMYYLDAQG